MSKKKEDTEKKTPKKSGSYIAVDLDGTLAYYDHFRGFQHIGDPIPLMLKRVQLWIKKGIRIKIFTARAASPNAIPYIKEWLKKHDLGDLEVTNVKDSRMVLLFDDRCISVEQNTGKISGTRGTKLGKDTLF